MVSVRIERSRSSLQFRLPLPRASRSDLNFRRRRQRTAAVPNSPGLSCLPLRSRLTGFSDPRYVSIAAVPPPPPHSQPTLLWRNQANINKTLESDGLLTRGALYGYVTKERRFERAARLIGLHGRELPNFGTFPSRSSKEQDRNCNNINFRKYNRNIP